MLASLCRVSAAGLGRHSLGKVRTLSVSALALSAKQRSGSSQRWLRRQREDAFTRQAQCEGYRARSAFKLIALDDKYHFLRPGHLCVDCGASPGGWSQVAAQRITSQDSPAYIDAAGDMSGPCNSQPINPVLAVDLSPMIPLHGVTFVLGDFGDQTVQARLQALLGGNKANVILSDMAPALSGIRVVDQAASAELFEAVLSFVEGHLCIGGTLVCKFFADGQEGGLKRRLRARFRQVCIEKPEASRTASAESYFVGLGWKGDTPAS